MKYDYTRQDIESCLGKIGVAPGDNLFIHSNIGFYGRMEGVKCAADLCEGFFLALKNVVGPSGTIVLPSFSYSFCHGEVYNPETTGSDCGMLTEYALKQPDTIRSLDPNFSVVSWGKLAGFYTENASHESFGADSFWARFLGTGGKLVCMNFDCGSTFVHFAERANNVPYRYNKAFNGIIELGGGKTLHDYAVHYIFDNERDYPTFDRLDRKCRETGICKVCDLGRGTMLAIDIRQYYDLICDSLKENPRFLTVGE